jgi:hypothetical protein
MSKLINYQYLRTEVDISQNVSDDELDNPIKRSQEILEMVIGTDLFNELDTQNPNFSTWNIQLMLFVSPFLAWQAYSKWLPKANFKSTRAGIRVHTEDNSTPATDAQMATLQRDAEEWAQTKKLKVVSFLNENRDNFPLWVQFCNPRRNLGTGSMITAIGNHRHGCKCKICSHG